MEACIAGGSLDTSGFRGLNLVVSLRPKIPKAAECNESSKIKGLQVPNPFCWGDDLIDTLEVELDRTLVTTVDYRDLYS